MCLMFRHEIFPFKLPIYFFIKSIFSRDAEMGHLTLKSKIYLHVFIPVTTVFILNNLFLISLETPGYLMINLLSFGVVITVSILSLRSLDVKEPAKPALHELSDDAVAIGDVYSDLKQLLVFSCQKDSLPIAKELARICSELGPAAADLDEKIEDLANPRKSAFRQGHLRNVYRYKFN